VKVVVTGASGKAGRAVVRDLLAHDYDVLGVDLVPPAAELAPFLLADLDRVRPGGLGHRAPLVHSAEWTNGSFCSRH
jgi:nucleoside-diphosphate-sugar epimerase